MQTHASRIPRSTFSTNVCYSWLKSKQFSNLLKWQGSTIGVRCVCTYIYLYFCTCDFRHAYPDMYAHVFSFDFLKFSKFFLIFIVLYCLKNFLLYIWPLIYLFVNKIDRFFIVYSCFKEILFFNFSYKLFKGYLCYKTILCHKAVLDL